MQTTKLVPYLLSLSAIFSPSFTSAITLGGSSVLVAPPSSSVNGAYESNTETRIWAEKTNFSLPSDVAVDVTLPGTYGIPLTPGIIPNGTRVNVYYLHIDPIGSTETTYSGMIAFDNPIIGIIGTDANLMNSDSLLGSSGTAYDKVSPRWEFGTDPGYDQLTIDANQLSLSFQSSAGPASDNLRIITAVPEPESSLLLISAVGLILLRARRQGVFAGAV